MEGGFSMERLTLTGVLALPDPSKPCCEGPVDIVVSDRCIVDLRPTGLATPEGRVIDGRGLLAVPGMINGHFHSHEHFHKGRYDNLPLELWMNYVRPLTPIPFTARQVYLRTMIGAIETLRCGSTTVCDDVNASPVLIPEHLEAVFQAYEDLGIRAFVGMTLFDRPFLCAVPFANEEIPPELLEQTARVQSTPPSEMLSHARGLAKSRHPRSHRVGFMAAPSAPQRCSREFLEDVRRMADEFDIPTMIHAQETRLQVVTGHELFGSTTIEYLHHIGFLKAKTALIHAVWLNDHEIDLIASSGATVQHNPYSNLKMGSGVAPIRALLNAGVNVSLASDGCGSVDTANMHKTLSTTALIHKLRGDDPTTWVGAEDAWCAATLGGAAALGFDKELGALAKGRLADIVCYRLDSMAFTPLNNPLRQLVFAETGADVELVLVDGKIVLEHGRCTLIDEARLIQEINEEHAKLAGFLADAEAGVEAILPAYRRIRARALAKPISQGTYQAKLH
jgi:guanine deaminase